MSVEIADKLARFIVETKLHQIPENVQEYTKCIMLKTVAGMLYGSTTKAGRAITTMIKGHTPSEAGVIACGFRAPVIDAALANGMFAHAAELEDDCFPTATADITVFPVIFPLADLLESTGEEVLEASVVACEVMNRVGKFADLAGKRTMTQIGISPLPSYGVIGAVVAAAKLLRLTFEQVKNALGLGLATLAMGSIVNFGRDAHFYESALACADGVIAALLAKEGCTGNPDFTGYFSSLLDANKEKLGGIVENLGGVWYTTEFWIKKYPVCFLTHRHVDATLELMREEKIRPEDIESIELDIGPLDQTVDRPDPRDPEDARFSIQHIIASAIIDGDVGVDTIKYSRIFNPKYVELRKKVKTVMHPDWPKEFMSGIAKVTIRLKDGRSISRERDQVIGGPKYPLTKEQYKDLYRKYASTVLIDEHIKWSANVILNIEKYEDLGDLIDLLVFRILPR